MYLVICYGGDICSTWECPPYWLCCLVDLPPYWFPPYWIIDRMEYLVQLLLRFWCDIFKRSSYLCAVCLLKYKMGVCRFWLKLCLGPVVLSFCVFYVVLYVTSLVKCDSYGFKLCVLVIMMAELRFYLKCVDFRSGLALRVTDWSMM